MQRAQGQFSFETGSGSKLTPKRHEDCIEHGPRVVEQVGHFLVQANVFQFPVGATFAELKQEVKYFLKPEINNRK